MPGLFVSVLHPEASSFFTECAKENRFPEVRLSPRHRWTALGGREGDRRGKPQAS